MAGTVAGPRPQPLWDRIIDGSVESESGCWLWQRQIKRDGYGHLTVGSRLDGTRRTARAHIVAYELWTGQHVPEGLTLDHYVCDTKHCVNPMHVRPATNWENVLRAGTSVTAVNLAKTHCKRGHEFTPENTGPTAWSPGGRRCRQCNREDMRRRYWARRAELSLAP